VVLRTRFWGFAVLVCALINVAACTTPSQPAASPKPAADPRGAMVFGPVASGYRDFGSTIVGEPGDGYFIGTFESQASFSASERRMQEAHSKAAIAARGTPYAATAGDCAGSGEDPAQAFVVRNLFNPADEVSAGIACAALQHPGATWIAVRLIGDDSARRYLSVIAFMGKNNEHIEAYADVSRFARSILSTP
jgi:hypothetical protein